MWQSWWLCWADLGLYTGSHGWRCASPRRTDKPAAQAEPEEEILARLVALNAERAAEEAHGLVRWLRPEFQAAGAAQPAQGEIDTGEEIEIAAAPAKKHTWPKTIPEQVQALRAALAAAPAPQTGEQLARGFARAQTKKVEELLETLAALGQARQDGARYAAV